MIAKEDKLAGQQVEKVEKVEKVNRLKRLAG
jgi:hypothetical protein